MSAERRFIVGRTVIPGSVARTVYITRPNSKSVRAMLLRSGYVFSITILAPDPEGICLENVFRSPIIQKYENVDGLEIQKIKDYASKEGD